jgi:apolipoprotein N-acyltransferase
MVLIVAGLGLASQPGPGAGGWSVAVACVQAEDVPMHGYVELTRQALADARRPGLVVLPEHTIETPATERNVTVRELSELARRYEACICVGAHTAPEGDAVCPYDNVGLVIGLDGRIAGVQAKCVPLPFFEDGNPARSQSPVRTVLGSLGVCVCFDALFTDVPRRVVTRGAEVLVVPVMDPERWPDQERLQHADMAPLRCIELRRCAVRAASSGVSQIIDATGRVQARRDKSDGQGVLFGTVGMEDRRTLFVRGGYLLAPAMAAVFLAAVGALTVAEWTPRRKRL